MKTHNSISVIQYLNAHTKNTSDIPKEHEIILNPSKKKKAEKDMLEYIKFH